MRGCVSVGVGSVVGSSVGGFVGRSVGCFVGRSMGGFVGCSVGGVVVLFQWCFGDVVIEVVKIADSPGSKKHSKSKL